MRLWTPARLQDELLGVDVCGEGGVGLETHTSQVDRHRQLLYSRRCPPTARSSSRSSVTRVLMLRRRSSRAKASTFQLCDDQHLLLFCGLSLRRGGLEIERELWHSVVESDGFIDCASYGDHFFFFAGSSSAAFASLSIVLRLFVNGASSPLL